MKKINQLLLPGLLLLAAVSQQAMANTACESLIQFSHDKVEIHKAEPVNLGVAPIDPMAAMTGANLFEVTLPDHCLVQGVIEPRTGANGKPYGIHFEMRLPNQWQQRLLFQGGGGMDGFVAQAIGRIPVMESTAAPALTRGYAVVSMDSGHQGLDASFGYDQQARLNYAYAAIGKVTQEAKQLIKHYYRKSPKYTYFMGCSNGGREAMIAAQRYPTEFDGIVAGNPGFHLSCAAMASAWDTQALMDIAPKDEQGHPILSQALTQADLDLVSERVAQACDSLDGLEDGLINHFKACRFSPKQLACKPNQTSGCLSADKIAAIEKVFSGPVNSLGQALYSRWPYDIGISAPGWRAWKLGFSPDANKPDALNITLGSDSLGHYFMTPPEPNFDILKFDFDRDAKRVQQTGALNDAVSTYLTTFKARGGKLLIYHGMSDSIFSADDIMNWYEALQQDTDQGDGKATRQWARLFMVPGMTHCGGGPALNNFDPLTAIEAWVERQRTPETLPAQGKNFPGISQPLCPYPAYAQYQGGDIYSIQSYQCVDPSL